MQEQTVRPGSCLIAASVNDPDGNYLGTIEELLIDLERGQVQYVVLCLDGRHRSRVSRVMLPWSLLRLDKPKGAFVSDASEDALERHVSLKSDEGLPE